MNEENGKGSEEEAERSGSEEYIPKGSPGDLGNNNGAVYADIAAHITQYTDRPDLFLEVIEKHDPGFIKKFNHAALEHSEQTHQGRFRFGKRQAYASLGVQVTSALVILAGFILMVVKGQVSFFSMLGVAIFYAVTQGGIRGFSRIIQACEKAISKIKGAG